MPKWDSSEAPVTVTVDDPDEYTGHMDDRPVKLSVDDADDRVTSGDIPFERTAPLQVSMSPAEAYHLADDLQAAADACWGGTEYLVTVVHSADSPEGPLESVLATIKAPDPEQAVQRAIDLVDAIGEREDAVSHRVRAGLAEEASTYHVYRADSLSAVRADDTVEPQPIQIPDREQWETILMVLNDHIAQLYGPLQSPDMELHDSAREEIENLERLRDFILEQIVVEA